MFRLIGLTGGIGMGKTTAAKMMEAKGAATIDTDHLGRDLVKAGEPALAEIEVEFGPGVLNAEGELDRAKLAVKIFGDPCARTALEGILHPKIRLAWKRVVSEWRDSGAAKIGVVAIPLLFETGCESEFDEIVAVACSKGTQHDRLRSRNWTREEIAQRNAAQLGIREKVERSDLVIWSEGSLDVLEAQVCRVLR